MLKYRFAFWFILMSAFQPQAQLPHEISCVREIETVSAVNDICHLNNKLILACENNGLDIVTLNGFKFERHIDFPKIIDFMGDSIIPNVYSADAVDSFILAACQGKNAFSDVYLIDDETMKKVISFDKRLVIRQIAFVNKNSFVFATLSNEIGLFDIERKTIKYLVPISAYSFSDFALSEDKTRLVSADESGYIHLFDIAKGKLVQSPESVNLDKIYKLDFAKNIVATAGRDRRLGVYYLDKNKSFYVESDFLIFCTAISPSGKYLAFMNGENGKFSIMDIESEINIANASHHASALAYLLFLDETTILSATENKELKIWKLK